MPDPTPHFTKASFSLQRYFLQAILDGHAEHVITAIDQLQSSLAAIQDHASNYLTLADPGDHPNA